MSCSVSFNPSFLFRVSTLLTILNTLGLHWSGKILKWRRKLVTKSLIGILTPPFTMATSGITTLPYPRDSIASNSGQYSTSTSSRKLYFLLNFLKLLGVLTIGLNFPISKGKKKKGIFYNKGRNKKRKLGKEWVRRRKVLKRVEEMDLQTRRESRNALKVAWGSLERNAK